jgi:peptidoglycan hydrolase-like protein with peptidoglycan-binding domain
MKSYVPASSQSSPAIAPQQAPPVQSEGAYPSAQAAPVGPRPLLRRGSTGENVRLLQQELIADGYTLEVDGIFGRITDSQVRAFQEANGLDPDGVVGPLSWAALDGPSGGTTGTGTTGTGTTGTGTTGTDTGTTGTDTGTTGTGTTGTGTTGTTGTDTGTTGTGTTGTGTGTTTPTVDEYMTALPTLPRGDALSAEQRATMYAMTATMTVDQIRVCFEHRFLHAMENTTGTWTVELSRAVWLHLDTLPDGHVTANTVLTTFQAISGGGGFGPSWEAPTQVNTIQLGEDNDPATIGHTVRHEVGHAVHAEGSYVATINSWLQNEVGFWFFPTGDAGLRQWVTDLGGFGSATTADSDTFMTHLTSFLGTGSSWDPTRPTFTEGLTPEDTAIYDAMPDGVKNGITQSTSYWYSNYANFASGTKGKYFLNYWYQRGFYMGPVAEACVTATGDDYTAMSEKEFFANCYAEFFEDPAGYSDPTLWGGSLPVSVQTFFRNQILDRQPYTPPDPAAAATTTTAPPPRPTGMAGTP